MCIFLVLSAGPAAVISALHYEPPPIDPYVYCSKNLAIHEVAGQGTLNFTSNSTLSPTPSPAPEASRTLTSTATRTALPSPTASQSPTGGVSPSPAPSPLGPSLCIGSPCYNSVSWRWALAWQASSRTNFVTIRCHRFDELRSISGPNITFGANCTLLGSASTGSNVVGWCGFGLSPTGLMVRARIPLWPRSPRHATPRLLPSGAGRSMDSHG